MEIMVRLSEDAEPTVQTELMEQIPPIVIFLQENRSNVSVVFSEYLIPIVVRYLTDQNNQIICKLASVLSKNTVERLLLPRFCELCGDGKLFQVRKIPKFFELCSDNVWGMRKACAECFMAVSHNTSHEVRRAQLSPLFIRLVSDSCRWVRQAAFQSLGPFISTFANPSRAGLCMREDGTLSIRPSAQSAGSNFTCRPASARNCVDATSACSSQPGHIEAHPPMGGPARDTSGFLHVKSSWDGPMGNPVEDSGLAEAEVTSAFSKLPDSNSLPTSSHPAPDCRACPGSPEDAFSGFLYWQTPLPDISQDLELFLSAAVPKEEGRCRSGPVCGTSVARSEIQKVLDSLQDHMMNNPDVQGSRQALSWNP